jgi:hypothetical protein
MPPFLISSVVESLRVLSVLALDSRRILRLRPARRATSWILHKPSATAEKICDVRGGSSGRKVSQMTLNAMRAGFLVGCWVVGSQVLRAECDGPRQWEPVVVKGAICGNAADASRHPFQDRDIELHDEAGHVIATSHTTANGDFTFPRVPDSTYRFCVRGFQTAFGAVRVAGRQARCGKPVSVVFDVGISCLAHVAFEGTLRLVTNVEYSFVSIDGEEDPGVDWDGVDDSRFYLPEGVHHLVIDGPPGYRALKFRVRIRAGQTTTYRADLSR